MMWAIFVSTLRRCQTRVYLLAPGTIVLAMVAFTGLRAAGAESPVKFLSEKVEAALTPAAAGGYQTEKPLDVVIQNDGEEAVQISFCLMPDGESECPSTGMSATINDSARLPDGSIQLDNGRIKDIKLNLTLPEEQDAAPQAAAAQPPVAATPEPGNLPVDWGTIQTVVMDGFKRAGQFVENEQPKSRTGLLILRVNGNDADAIPYTLTPAKEPDSFFDQLTTEQVVCWGLFLAALAVLGAILPFLNVPLLNEITRADPKNKLPRGALFQLPMGVAEWKLDDSWVINLSLAIAILGGIEGLLPDSLTGFKTSYSGLIFLFGVLTAGAAFAYNATTWPGPEKEDGKQTYKKQGRTGIFLLASWLVVWALLGQLGLQLMAVERIRDVQDLEIPGGFLLVFQGILLLLIIFVLGSTVRTLHATILEQKIDAHKKAFKQSKFYLRKVSAIKNCALKWYRKFEAQEKLIPAKISEEFANLVPPLDSEMQWAGDEKKLYGYFHELFHTNLPVLLKSTGKDNQAVGNLLRAVADDAADAEKLLRQTLPIEDAVAAFYSSLWAPRQVREKNYTLALDKTARHLRVACAQASSPVEPDRVIGPNEELYTNILVTLDGLDKALGLAGKKDPFYANLKKLFENARLKWEVMTIRQLESHLCGLADSLEKCKKKLEALFKEKGQGTEIGEARLAMTLEPLAAALSEPVPYPKTFPVDTEELDRAYAKDHTVGEALEKISALNVKTVRRKVKSRSEKPATREPSRQKERRNLQASLLAIASDPIEITPYADPTADREFQQNRIKALQQNGQKKVMGEDVTLL